MGPEDLWGLVISLRDRGLAVLNRAELTNDGKLTLAALRELRGMVETLSRLAPAHGAAGSTAALAQTDEWANLRGIIIGALADHPEARLAVATALAGAGALT